MSSFSNIAGQRFGRVVAISPVHKHTKRADLYWICKCDCGNHPVIRGDNLRNGTTKSCGCFYRKHGMSNSREFRTWLSMFDRCYNTNHPLYRRYGGRGIIICDKWRKSFTSFYEDIGEAPRGKSLDRVDNDGNYEPKNCRWATPSEQQQNTIQTKPCNIHGVSYTSIGIAANALGISRSTLRWRLDNKFDGYEVLK